MTDKPPSQDARQDMSEWLRIMLLEIDRKNDEQSRAETEHRRRTGEPIATSPNAVSDKASSDRASSNRASSKITPESRR